MSEKPGIWFVYRSHYEGPLSKRVRRLEAPSVLAWFQAQIEEARVAEHPGESVAAALGGPVHGLPSVFEASHKHSLHTPKTATALRKVLGDHLHVRGGEENIHLDGHSLRVLTSDGAVELAYFLFDDEAVSRAPDRLAWLVHDEPRLPEGDADGAFSPPVEVAAYTPAGSGEGATYACLLTYHNRESLPGQAGVFPGVRLPGLAAHLRAVVPDSKGDEHHNTWPVELRLLRGMLDDGDTTLGPALARAAAYPLSGVANKDHARLGTGAFAASRPDFLAAAEGLKPAGDPAKSTVHETTHTALLSAHQSEKLGYQQWIFFDDRWAAAHRDLAASILHYASHWDPFAVVRSHKAGKDAKTGKAPKSAKAPKSGKDAKPGSAAKAGTNGKPAKAAKASAAATAAANKHDHAWKSALAGRGEDDARAYAPSGRFNEGELIKHAKFGVGVVFRSEGSKIEAIFSGTSRFLVQGQ